MLRETKNLLAHLRRPDMAPSGSAWQALKAQVCPNSLSCIFRLQIRALWESKLKEKEQKEMPVFPLAKQRDKSRFDSNCIKKMGTEQFVKMSQLRTPKNSPTGLGTAGCSMLDLNSLVFSL